jgi:hypothetical protein
MCKVILWGAGGVGEYVLRYSPASDAVFQAENLQVLRIAPGTPRMNANRARIIQTLRHKLCNQVLIIKLPTVLPNAVRWGDVVERTVQCAQRGRGRVGSKLMMGSPLRTHGQARDSEPGPPCTPTAGTSNRQNRTNNHGRACIRSRRLRVGSAGVAGWCLRWFSRVVPFLPGNLRYELQRGP